MHVFTLRLIEPRPEMPIIQPHKRVSRAKREKFPRPKESPLNARRTNCMATNLFAVSIQSHGTFDATSSRAHRINLLVTNPGTRSGLRVRGDEI